MDFLDPRSLPKFEVPLSELAKYKLLNTVSSFILERIWSGHCGQEEALLSVRGIDARHFSRPAGSLVDTDPVCRHIDLITNCTNMGNVDG